MLLRPSRCGWVSMLRCGVRTRAGCSSCSFFFVYLPNSRPIPGQTNMWDDGSEKGLIESHFYRWCTHMICSGGGGRVAATDSQLGHELHVDKHISQLLRISYAAQSFGESRPAARVRFATQQERATSLIRSFTQKHALPTRFAPTGNSDGNTFLGDSGF